MPTARHQERVDSPGMKHDLFLGSPNENVTDFESEVFFTSRLRHCILVSIWISHIGCTGISSIHNHVSCSTTYPVDCTNRDNLQLVKREDRSSTTEA